MNTEDTRPAKSLVARIEEELVAMERLLSDLRAIQLENGMLSRRARGSVLHDFYNCCERVFRMVTQEIDGENLTGERWHRSVLAAMTREIRGVRPTVISQETASILDEYLGFRHVFRNIYGFELLGERIDRLCAALPTVAERTEREIRRFLASLSTNAGN